jgi:hypothetical protein
MKDGFTLKSYNLHTVYEKSAFANKVSVDTETKSFRLQIYNNIQQMGPIKSDDYKWMTINHLTFGG